MDENIKFCDEKIEAISKLVVEMVDSGKMPEDNVIIDVVWANKHYMVTIAPAKTPKVKQSNFSLN